MSVFRAARLILKVQRVRVTDQPEVLATLPGIGPYTAAAVASMAFGRSVPAVDTNVWRVSARAFLGKEPGDVARSTILQAAEAWVDPSDPGAWNQAMMDLGREVCRPRPRCGICPLAARCLSQGRVRPSRSTNRRQPSFPGSSRQVRGGVVRALA